MTARRSLIALPAVLLLCACSALYPDSDNSSGASPSDTTAEAAPLDVEPDLPPECEGVHVHAMHNASGVRIDFHDFKRGVLLQTDEGWFLADCAARELHHALAGIEAHDIDTDPDPEVTLAEGNEGIVLAGLPEIRPIVGASYPVSVPAASALALDLLLDAHFHVPPPTTQGEHAHPHRHDLFHIESLGSEHAHPHRHDDHRPYDHDHV